MSELLDNRRVLVVDDDPAIRDAIASTLADEGYEVSSAENGRQALDFLISSRGWGQCLVLLDLMMPEMDGISLLGKLHELGASPNVVVVTAAAPGSALPGDVPVLRKPFGLDELLCAVERYCGRTHLGEERPN